MKSKKTFYIFIIFAFLILPFFLTQNVQGKEYEISNYDIDIELTKKGDYIITEKITYNFLEGKFSNAYREITNNSLKNLEFISLDGVFTNITNERIEESGNDLKINWSYPETDQNAEFILKYRSNQALTSKENKNIIDLKIIEEGWDVPLKNIDISIDFPESVSGISVKPQNDLETKDTSMVKFYKESLDPNESYNIFVEFNKIIDTNYPEEKSPYFYPLIFGAILGILFIIFTVVREYYNRPEPQKTNIKPSELSCIELANISYPKTSEKRKGLVSEIFTLAQKGKIKLISKLDSGLFGSKKAEIKVEILSEEDLSQLEEELINSLKKEDDLKEFLQKSKLSKNIMEIARENLKDLDLFNNKAGRTRITDVYIGVLTSILGVAGLILAPFSGYPSISGISIFLVLLGIGRFIKSALVPMLSATGLGLQKEVEKVLDEKKDEFEKALDEDANKAIELFFSELNYLILHKKFRQNKFKKYKKKLKNADEFEKPEWIEFDMSELDKTIDALEAVEIIDYVMVSTIFILNSTAGVTGVTGAGGGSAGGGGAS
ncbi:MAG: DUF2207 domain-containing protein [Bacillota bacterium]